MATGPALSLNCRRLQESVSCDELAFDRQVGEDLEPKVKYVRELKREIRVNPKLPNTVEAGHYARVAERHKL